MSKRIAGAVPIMGLLSILLFPFTAEAIPAFSRQVHGDCRTCHFQNAGSLNAYGRAFKANGFRESEKMREMRKHREQERERRSGKNGK